MITKRELRKRYGKDINISDYYWCLFGSKILLGKLYSINGAYHLLEMQYNPKWVAEKYAIELAKATDEEILLHQLENL